MNVGINSAVHTGQTTGINNIADANKTSEKSSILNKALNKLAEGRDFILKKLGNKTNTLITLGQVGGAAAMTLGGAALLFSGVGASLTVSGFPLAIPLLAGGATMFAAGTGLLIAKISANAKSTLGEKIKTFFSVTCKNALVGIGIGTLGSLFTLERVQKDAVAVAAGIGVVDKAVGNVKAVDKEVDNIINAGMDGADMINQAIGNFEDENIPNNDKTSNSVATNDVKDQK